MTPQPGLIIARESGMLAQKLVAYCRGRKAGAEFLRIVPIQAGPRCAIFARCTIILDRLPADSYALGANATVADIVIEFVIVTAAAGAPAP